MLFSPDRTKAVSGIIAFLRSTNQTNKYGAITNSEDPSYPKENVLDILTESFWGSNKTSESVWIGVSFSHYKTRITHYTIRQYEGDGNMFKSWLFQGSNDGLTWNDIDNQTSETFCQNGTVLDTFAIPPDKQDYYNQYRFYRYGGSCLFPTYWRLSGIELFGSIDFLYCNTAAFQNILPIIGMCLLSIIVS